ncbi:MAG: type II secretion system minor pseudopilin GspK [Steroidobacteraceae bacterium]
MNGAPPMGQRRIGRRGRGHGGLRRERGIALLTAILLVALGTMIATAMAYRTAMTARRGQGDFALDQSILIGEAGEAIAGYALRESRAKYPKADAPGQPWTRHYGPVPITDGVTLEAWLEDMQGRFNLNNLVDASGTKDPKAIQAFEKLLQNPKIGLEPKWAELLADWIDADTRVDSPDGAEDSTYLSQIPPYRAANRQITSASALLALPGFGPDRYARIAPFVTALPRTSTINLCTASKYVLDALLPPGEYQYSLLDDQALREQRSNAPNGCFPTPQDITQTWAGQPQGSSSFATQMSGMQSDYFRLTSVVSIGSAQFYLYSLLHREQNGSKARVIQRSFTAD